MTSRDTGLHGALSSNSTAWKKKYQMGITYVRCCPNMATLLASCIFSLTHDPEIWSRFSLVLKLTCLKCRRTAWQLDCELFGNSVSHSYSAIWSPCTTTTTTSLIIFPGQTKFVTKDPEDTLGNGQLAQWCPGQFEQYWSTKRPCRGWKQTETGDRVRVQWHPDNNSLENCGESLNR